MEAKILKELARIRPQLQMDGGDMEFVSFDESSGVLTIKLQGACVGCPMSQITLHQGISQMVRSKIKAVKEVVAI